LLEAIVSGDPPSSAAWQLTSPGALLCRDWLTRADGTGSPGAEVEEDGGDQKGDDTPDAEISREDCTEDPEDVRGKHVPPGNDESAKKPLPLDEAEFKAITALAQRASGDARASILGLARERAVDVPDLGLRWERLIKLAKLERSPGNHETIGCTWRCPAEQSQSPVNWAGVNVGLTTSKMILYTSP
jgi:hypothetical protein